MSMRMRNIRHGNDERVEDAPKKLKKKIKKLINEDDAILDENLDENIELHGK